MPRDRLRTLEVGRLAVLEHLRYPGSLAVSEGRILIARAHITLTVEFDCAATKLDKRILKATVRETLTAGNMTIWDAHARAEVEPGGRIVEWDLTTSEEER